MPIPDYDPDTARFNRESQQKILSYPTRQTCATCGAFLNPHTAPTRMFGVEIWQGDCCNPECLEPLTHTMRMVVYIDYPEV